MNLQDAAEELGIKDTSQLRKLIAKNQLAAKKEGRDWWIHEDEVQRYKANRPGRGRPRKQPLEPEGPAP